MKAIPAVALVLLAFAAFFMTFLVAPLAVLVVFYVALSFRAAHRVSTPPATEPRPRWGASAPSEPVAAPVRRARINVESHSARASASAARHAAASTDTVAAAGDDPTTTGRAS
jgi:hypothetical protein